MAQAKYDASDDWNAAFSVLPGAPLPDCAESGGPERPLPADPPMLGAAWALDASVTEPARGMRTVSPCRTTLRRWSVNRRCGVRG